MSHVLRRALRALLATLCLASSTFTFAHQLQVEPVAIKIRPQSSFYTLEFTGNVQDITQIPEVTKDIQCVQGNSFTPAATKALEQYINQRFQMGDNGVPIPGEIQLIEHEAGLDPTKARFKLLIRYARTTGGQARPLQIASTLFDYLPNALATINVAGFQRNLKPGESTEVDASNLASNLLRNVIDFLWLGAIHIWEGLDHLLFIFGLLLVAPNLRMLIKVLTGFTIAHSITLILSALQIVSVPGKFVDPLVAVSIIFVGVENIVAKKHDRRFWIAAGFGLIHGFAFAGNLRAAGLPEGNALFWSLLSFNVGVELAQLSVCLGAWPILKYLEKSMEKGAKRGGIAYPAIVRFASGGIAAMGLWLFIKLFVAAE